MGGDTERRTMVDTVESAIQCALVEHGVDPRKIARAAIEAVFSECQLLEFSIAVEGGNVGKVTGYMFTKQQLDAALKE